MRSQITLLLLLALPSSALAQGQDCGSALPIATLGSFEYSNTGASPAVTVPDCIVSSGSETDVWFEWTTGLDPHYRLRTCAADLDVVLGVYDACGGSLVGCADQGFFCAATNTARPRSSYSTRPRRRPTTSK